MHLMGAAVVSGVAATGLVMTGVVTHQAVVSYFILGVIGGLLPDIDSPNSIPIRVAFNVLAVITGFLLVFSFSQHYSLAELVILWIACFVGMRYGVFNLFTHFTVHRGLIHSIPAGICFGLATTLLAYRVFGATALHAWNCGIFVLAGFVVHLLLDEFYSVNLLGMDLKSSFGSALNLGSLANPLGTVALYVTLMVLFYLCPTPHDFINAMVNEDMYRTVRERALPKRGWFHGLFGTLTHLP
jgi:hypothetical protein